MHQAGGQAGIEGLALPGDWPGWIGVDEVGRGPLAGPVLAAAVLLDPARPVPGLNDSKKLSPRRREQLAVQICDQALAWSIARAEVAEIDRLNILHASLLAMRRAVQALCSDLGRLPPGALIDGNRCPELPCVAQAVVGGDGLIPQIGAASIIAKVARDRELTDYEQRFPGYGFAQHKGYPSRQHLEALQRLGPCAVHRRSFGPVRRALGKR